MLDRCDTHFWVHPFDLDMNMHMNNGRYLSLMDLGRFDLMLRAGVFWKLMLRGYYPVVVSESIRFKKSLELFHSFRIETQVSAWDQKDFYILQNFYRGTELMAVGYIRGRFRKRGLNPAVLTSDLFRELNLEIPSEKMDSRSRAQFAMDRELLSNREE